MEIKLSKKEIALYKQVRIGITSDVIYLKPLKELFSILDLKIEGSEPKKVVKRNNQKNSRVQRHIQALIGKKPGK